MRWETIAADRRAHDIPLTKQRKRERRIGFYAAIFIVEILGIALAFVGAAFVRNGTLSDYAPPILALVIVLFAGLSRRSYNSETLLDWAGGARRASGAMLLSVLIVVAMTYAAKVHDVSRVWMGMSLALSLGLLWINRFLFAWFARASFLDGTQSRLLITDGMDVAAGPNVDRYDATVLALHEGGIDAMLLDAIAQRIAGYDVVAICAVPERRRAWAHALQGCAKPTYMLIPELDMFGSLHVSRFEGVPMVVASAGALDLQGATTKRAFDLLVSGVLLVALAPLFGLVALAIKADSPGPVFFRQRRVGLGNGIFPVLKFRSMRHDRADGSGARSAVRGDDRITRVGRFIRHTSIDELPQLLNVLVGDMSLVGPRPHALGSLVGDQLFWEIDPRYHYRHACKPGLTGLAQVRGYRGATEKRDDLVNRLNADLEYRKRWSLWRDIGILLATMRVLVHRNAF